MLTLEKVQNALDLAVEQIGGIDAAIEACDRMYRQVFIREPFPLSEVEEDVSYDLLTDLALVVYQHETGRKIPVKPDYFENDWQADNYYGNIECYTENALSYIENKYPDFKLSSDTLVVETCNYKGEGEGVELYCLHKNTPIFKSKRESFNL